MKRLFTAFMLICLVFAFAPDADAQVKFRGFTALTGGGTGALDKIPVAELVNGDIGFVATDTYFYVYKFNSTATNAESSPNYIRPNDYATEGVWVLTGLYGVTLKGGPSATPTIEFYDSDATDGDINAKIYVNCTTATSSENCEMYFQTQVAGTLATRLTIDASGNAVASGTLSGKMPTVVENTSTTYNVTTAQAEAGTFFVNTAAGTKTFVLPAAAAGMAVCVRQGQGTATALRVDTDGTDYLVLNSTGVRTTSAGDYIEWAASNKNQFCVVAYDATDWYVTSETAVGVEQ